MNARQSGILAIGFATALAAWLAPGDTPSGDDREAPASVASEQRDPWPSLAVRSMTRPAPNVFGARPWHAPAPVVVSAPAPPPPPRAPPLPFSYLGRLHSGEEGVTLFLARGDRVYAVALGEIVDGDYLIEGIANGELTITYLPLNIRQSLGIGSDS